MYKWSETMVIALLGVKFHVVEVGRLMEHSFPFSKVVLDKLKLIYLSLEKFAS